MGETLSAADSLLVKVTTDDGVVGWGEAFGLYGTALAVRALDDLVAPLCLGHGTADIAALMDHVQRKLHVFGRGGAITYALSAVDIALWDIAGKRAGVPISRLLGRSGHALLRQPGLLHRTAPGPHRGTPRPRRRIHCDRCTSRRCPRCTPPAPKLGPRSR
ncbi:hypothetical protein MTER_00110 [Mycolicibacter terrae]|uniref:Mandelate racemase/muconate lactonizing enzyme N-terminal domain-containing protein n=1 Tax=Mycolicibacter terrae TaxID=1788 RepID=A0AAD1HTI2_9MYCO|nr:hypothetical protein [Mycolicibacter terrae]BBX20600.1 hypothetical protein MTER_00110 [Mycolicibacter terrae]